MYQKIFRTKSVRYVALAASLLPTILSGTAQAVQYPEDKLIPFAEPIPYMPLFENGEFDDHNVFLTLDGYEGFGSANSLESLEDEAKKLSDALKEARESLEKARKNEDRIRLKSAEARVEALERAALTTRQAAERARHLAPLQKKVDVKFDNATVGQAAEALSKASGVAIKVDDSISDATRLTVVARRVSLASVLESVARQAGLSIEPINIEKGDIGVELVSQPMLRVNDVVQNFPTAPSPWSEKWGSPPTRRFIFNTALPTTVWNYTNGDGRRVSRATAGGVSAEVIGSLAGLGQQYGSAGQKYAVAFSGKPNQLVLNSEKGTTIEITRPDTITVIETAKNDKNEDGYWRTVYTLKNGELVQQSRTWEKAKEKAKKTTNTTITPDSGSSELLYVGSGKV